MQTQPRIAIIGAGMGGLTAAIFLQRFGFDVDVFEQAVRLERLGAGIQLAPHVTRIFSSIGMFERMAAFGIIPRQRYGRNGYTGEITLTVPVGDFPTMYGAPPLTMHRGDLQEALLSPIAPGTIRTGKRLLDVAETNSAVRLTFADGSTAEADIVIGADGINSRIRELMLGPEQPIYTGEVAYRSIFPFERLGGLEVADLTKWWGDDRNILIYFITHAREVIYLVTGVPEPDWGSDDYAARPADLGALRGAFAGFHADVMQVLEAAPSATAWPIFERDPLPLWSRGRIVLLGDACHPMRPHMGQGAAMAIEDGVMLARCIDHFKGRDTAAIFRLYEAMRRERASIVQSGAQTDNWLRHDMGNAVLTTDWLYGYDVLKVPLDTGPPARETVPQ